MTAIADDGLQWPKRHTATPHVPAVTVNPMDDDRALTLGNLLLRKWDVLEVADSDVSPQSEYLHEAQGLLELLSRGASEDEVAGYLSRRSTELTSSHNEDRNRRAAVAVLEWSDNGR